MNESPLRLGTGHREPSCRSVLVQPCLPDDTLDVVSIGESRAECLKHDSAYTLPTSVSVGIFVPHAAKAVW